MKNHKSEIRNPKLTRLLAVDLGASGGKCFAGIFEGGGFSMREIHRFEHESVSFHVADRTGDVRERMVWDDTLIHANIMAGLHAYRREVGDVLDAVGIDTWGADGHILSADGDMLGKIYAYRDHRLDAMIEQVKARISAERIYAITGIHFQPFNVSNQLLWLIRNRRNLLLPGCRYAPIPSLFYYYLGGVIKVDSTWASVTQLMDARTRTWSREILDRLEVPPDILPEIVSPGAVIGALHQAIAETAGLNRARLVAVGGHDTASAFAAAPVADPGEALIISSGTWSLVGRLVPEPITTPEAMALNLSNEGGIGNIRLLKNCMGGWLAHELRRAWRGADGKEMAWAEMYRQAEAATAFAAFIDPDDAGFYNPQNMEKALIEYCRKTGQAAPAGRGGLLRMVYESLALKYRRINEDIARICGKRSAVIHIVGGGSRNEMLNQFTADATGLPVMAGPVEATGVGNLMVQAMGLGRIRSLSEAMPIIKQAFPIKPYQPRDITSWNRAYAQFRKMLPGYWRRMPMNVAGQF
ncbi:MAG: rhamnulokinase [Verrucomicrobia bacterium]|nr:rhamnulokinase [Verrucomicrobiota bacterium]MBU4291738.1 rhamnulokinase [Verrucomicrobiota bacterium]MBU4429044.1 rhamnulokinase [Verrucomicrobiota bacterium]MCG2679328.1 rhamnulokinase [Kiritimatiellia bacterium]